MTELERSVHTSNIMQYELVTDHFSWFAGENMITQPQERCGSVETL
jgi:hypothetical protein